MNPEASQLWRAPRWALAILLAALATVGPFSIDTYIPAFAGIAKALDATPIEMQQTLQVLGVLHEHRLVQTHLRADAREILGGGQRSGQRVGRVAGRQTDQHEHRRERQEHRQHALAETPQDVARRRP